MDLNGEIGERVQANLEHWLLTTPDANPGIIEMFRLRDRSDPYPNPVDWAGEFFGKYLISATQALRMTADPRLAALLRARVAEFIGTQSPEGYLGPYPEAGRLTTGWDLWGHYHSMLGLYKYYRATGDRAAMDAALKAADFICDKFLDGSLRVYDSHWLEMNMGIVHVMGILYRQTGNPRYLALMRQIEEDWPRPESGDYLNEALSGVDFYMTRKPRWESLPILQGLGEFYRITGDEKYKQALLNDWHSIVQTDVHNSGAFSSGEQAVGNPYNPMPIETCCTVAWIALSIDALELSHDAVIADAIEGATWNAMLGAQHPSGRWWTYNTPMDGRRDASTQSIVFQARPGTPELNCCSVNGPRSLGMIPDWAALTDAQGTDLNYYGPGTMTLTASDGTTWTLTQETAYPAEGRIVMTIHTARPMTTQLRLRIPGWSRQTRVLLNGAVQSGVTPGTYLTLERTWQDGDRIELELDLSLRLLRADQYQDYRVSIFRGPLLLACDQKDNPFDPAQMPVLDAGGLTAQPVAAQGRFSPMLLLEFKAADGQPVRLRDFASAGAAGTAYRSWLAMQNIAPGSFMLEMPPHQATRPGEKVLLAWSRAAPDASYRVCIARDPALEQVVFEKDGLTENQLEVPGLPMDGAPLYWRVWARNATGETASANGPWRLNLIPAPPTGPEGESVASALAGDPKASIGEAVHVVNVTPAADRHGHEGQALAFDGVSSKILYRPTAMPIRDYTLVLWARLNVGDQGLDDHTIVSAWCMPQDDPMRIMLTGNRLTAGLEQERPYKTRPVVVESGRWVHLALVKDGGTLTFYIDGEAQDTIEVPELLRTRAEDLGLGANPHFVLGFNAAGVFSDFALYNRTLPAERIKELSRLEDEK